MKTAVVLNGNAKRVGPRLISNFRQLIPERDLFISTSMDEARAITAHLVEAGYERIMSGGGDGTFVQVVNDVVDRVRAENLARPNDRPRDYPQIGLLRLGTGNAVAGLTGASRPTRDLMRLRDGRVGPPIPVDMVVAEGRRFPFAGLGYDGELLNDYLWLKERIDNPILKRLFHSVAGYFVALGLKTIPRHVRGRGISTTMRITALEPAWYMDPLNGDEPVEHPAGIMPEGAARWLRRSALFMVTASASFHSPVKSQNLSRCVRRERVHAVANIGVPGRGSYRNPQGCLTSRSRIRIESDAPLPYQVGGDGAGWRTEVEFAVDDLPIPLVNMRPALTAGNG